MARVKQDGFESACLPLSLSLVSCPSSLLYYHTKAKMQNKNLLKKLCGCFDLLLWSQKSVSIHRLLGFTFDIITELDVSTIVMVNLAEPAL